MEATAQAAEPVVSFKISDINQILSALGKIPAEHSMNLILFIKQTAEQQLGSAEAPAVTEAEVVE